MINLSKRAVLALYVMVELSKSDGPKTSSELAGTLGVSVNHLSKVTAALARAGWISSTPGLGGGYAIIVNPSQVSIADVIEQVDGPIDIHRCIRTGEPHHSGNPCACGIGKVIREVNEVALQRLRQSTLDSLDPEPPRTRLKLLEDG